MFSNCPNCGRANHVDSRFCQGCGLEQTGGAATGLLPPNTLLAGRYLILAKVGEGGMGAVYTASDTRLGQTLVAIKELSTASITDNLEKHQVSQSFEQEARMLAALNHPNLPRVTDHFNENGKQYLVMDFVKGQTLETLLQLRPGPFPVERVIAWGLQLCDVLTYLHNQRPPIIFRDLKPGNIMLDDSGQIKLIDFGIARLFKPGKSTDTVSFGTAGYAPPEQYGKHQTDARSDIYALGATLHQLLTGRDPTQAPFQFPPLRPLNPQVSPALEEIVLRAIETQPARRWLDVTQMRLALAAALSAPPATGPVPPAESRASNKVFFVGGLLAASLILLFGGASSGLFQTSRSRNELPPPTRPTGLALHAATSEPALPGMVDTATPTLTPTPTASATATIPPTPTASPTLSPTSAASATPAGPQGRIVFSSDQDGNNELYHINADGSGQRRLTFNPRLDDFPNFSADGTLIVFTSDRFNSDDLFTIRPDGTEEQRITQDPGWERIPSWSPDGRSIFFNYGQGNQRRLVQADVGGHGWVQLDTLGLSWAANPDCSPDGRTLLFHGGTNVESSWELYRMELDGSGHQRLTSNRYRDWGARWSPDGSQIAFLSNRDGDWEIFLMNADGTDQRQISDNRSEEYGVIWSPDGQWLAFNSNRSGRHQIYLMRPNGSDERQLTLAGGWYPSWAP
jgi:serine/threonine protein kinase